MGKKKTQKHTKVLLNDKLQTQTRRDTAGIQTLTSHGFWPSLFSRSLMILGCEHSTLTTSGHPNLQAK